MATRDPQLRGLEFIRLRDGFVQLIRDHFPTSAVKEVCSHRGKWTVKSIDRYSRKVPCVLVAYTGASGFETTGAGSSLGEVTWTAFAMTDALEGDSDDAALAITCELLRIIPGAKLADGSAAADVSGLNAYVDDLEDKGLDVHAVSWTQQVTLLKLTPEELAALPDFLRLFSTYPMGGVDDPDAEHMNNVRDQ